MVRGIISGVFWGGVISALAAAVVSLNGPLPGDAPPEAGSAEVPAGSQFNQAREDRPAQLPKPEEVAKTPEASGPAVPDRDDLAGVGEASRAPAGQPETGQPETAMVVAPPAGESGAGIDGSAADAPVRAVTDAPLPNAPEVDSEPALSTRPAAPAASSTAPARDEAEADAAFPTGDLQAAAESPVVAAPNEPGTRLPQDGSADRAPSAQTQPAARPAAPETAGGMGSDVAALPETGGATASAPDTAPARRDPAAADAGAPPGRDTAPAPIADDTSEVGDDTASVADENDETGGDTAETGSDTAEAGSDTAEAGGDAAADGAAAATDGAAAGTTGPVASVEPASEGQPPVSAIPGKPAVRIIDNDDRARTERVPSLGTDAADAPPEGAATEQAAGDGAAETTEEPDPNLPPIRRYAAEFDPSGDEPLMSIVLIDDGTSAVETSALSGFPYPLSVALDPAWDGAGAAMEQYRAAGLDVLLLADLPGGARPQDLEANFEAWSAQLPEVVGVMEAPGSALQESRALTDQLADILSSTGHGLVLYPNGLDTARKLASRQGVPAATIFRDFDADGQAPDVIRRFLDHAAFRAGQEGGVVMVGRLRPETVQALLVWGLQDRASSVSLAPISALLLDGAEG